LGEVSGGSRRHGRRVWVLRRLGLGPVVELDEEERVHLSHYIVRKAF
jgi:hypothetical protein